MSPVNHFGPGVIGDEEYTENKKVEESGANIFGPGVLGTDEPAPQTSAPATSSEEAELLADNPPPAAEPGFTSLSIAQLQKALEANPADFDRLYQGEFARPEGVRRGAAGVFLSFEQLHQNRPEVTSVLIELLKKKREAP